MLQKVTFPFSGVQPAILPQLLPKTTSKAKRTTQHKPSHGSKTSGEILRKITLPSGCVLQIVQADMAELSVDAVVNPTSSNFYMGGMAHYAHLLSLLSNTLGNLGSHYSFFKAHITDAPNLKARHVVHVNGPLWDSTLAGERLSDLERCIENCLRLASGKELTSLAMPSIGSGRAGFPKAAAAETIVKTIKKFLNDNALVSLRDVQFVLYDQESIDCYVYELNRTT
ncbi:unnamed protein product [Dibothriocephalus latus]|uniref:Macro domain-containing protein n=1 Tax=Dibothriocephalus latus TaxID=60516 RepID=A0A3P6UQF2_DIBLA|nr:unnamed protein product [Dibothriocephalus latus]